MWLQVEKRTGVGAVVTSNVVAGTPQMTPRMPTPATKLFPAQGKVPLDAKKQPPVGRGAPPPVPPNKPVIPPKKDTILCRRGDAALPTDDAKSSPQTLKYGMTVKENKVGGGAGDQVGEAEGDEAPVEDLELELHRLALNSSS